MQKEPVQRVLFPKNTTTKPPKDLGDYTRIGSNDEIIKSAAIHKFRYFKSSACPQKLRQKGSEKGEFHPALGTSNSQVLLSLDKS